MSLFRFVVRFPFVIFKPTVEAAITGLTQAVRELEQVVEVESAEIELRSQQIADLQIANHESSNQVYRANAIKRKIAELIA